MIALAYVGAAAAANLIIANLGPWATIPTAGLFVGLDFTLRDRLHDQWRGRALWPRMLALIVAGAAASWLVNPEASRIAGASVIAFLASGIADALVYHRTRSIHRSNVAEALVDSLLFPTLAFGALLPGVVLGQFAAKVLGGAVWALVIRRWRHG